MPRRLLVATTIPETAWTIMRGQLQHLQRSGFDVVLVSSPGRRLEQTGQREGIDVRAVPMRRELSPMADLIALWRLFRLLRAEPVDISYVCTPKAALLAGLAAAAVGTRTRIYALWGLRLETEHGWRRAILWVSEWISIHTAHHVIAVSPSLLDRARQLRLLGKRRGVVLARGASNGVDVDALVPTCPHRSDGAHLRDELGIPEGDFVFGFVGRMTVDKGISELLGAFAVVQDQHPDVWLVIAGAEELAGLPEPIRRQLTQLRNVRLTGWIEDAAPVYQAIDCLVLPSYREGFPNVPLEAAAAGRPVITTSVTGAVDSIIPNQTGLLVKPRSASDLAAAMKHLAGHREQARQMGEAGRRFVVQHYTNQIVWRALTDFLDATGAQDASHNRRHR
ncbi:MAG: glycosyltransferase family 4 protein [Nakamurella sp.]